LTPYEKSRAAFNEYAGMPADVWPENPVSRLQVALHRWQVQKFNSKLPAATCNTLGQAEEYGELCEALLAEVLSLGINVGKLCHIDLKSNQGLRGIDTQRARELASDAIGDQLVFLFQACTTRRLDAWTLLSETIAEVTTRIRPGIDSEVKNAG
jgi:hypothetical protein